MKVRSNLSRNSRESLSSEDRASSPTTAFIAAVLGVELEEELMLGFGNAYRHRDQWRIWHTAG